jgi:hypothetical protein
MRFSRYVLGIVLGSLLGCTPGLFEMSGFAQIGNTFKGRLSKIPVDAKMVPIIVGTGTATAQLAGSRVTISGAFEGMLTPATSARLYESRIRGTRGKPVGDLTVTKAADGTISGVVGLSASQVDSLKAGRLYIQIDSEKGPEGHLWGWLLP